MNSADFDAYWKKHLCSGYKVINLNKLGLFSTGNLPKKKKSKSKSMSTKYVIEINDELIPYLANNLDEISDLITDYKNNNGGDEPDSDFTIYKLGSKYKMTRTVNLDEIKPVKKKAKKVKTKHRKVTMPDSPNDDIG